LPPHIETFLVKAKRTTANVYLEFKISRSDRLFAYIAELPGALASEALRRRFGREW